MLPWYLCFSPLIPQGQPNLGTEGKGPQTCCLACHSGVIYHLGIADSMFKPWYPTPSPCKHSSFLQKVREKGYLQAACKTTEFTEFTQKGTATTSDWEAMEVCICLLGGKLQLDHFSQPSVFHRSCHSSLYNHRSTQTPHWTRLIESPPPWKPIHHHFHLSCANGLKSPVWSIKAFFPPPEKEDATQRLSRHWPDGQRSSRAAELEQEQWEINRPHQQLWMYHPTHKPHGRERKTFSSRHQPSFQVIPSSLWASVYFCSSCLIFSLCFYSV